MSDIKDELASWGPLPQFRVPGHINARGVPNSMNETPYTPYAVERRNPSDNRWFFVVSCETAGDASRKLHEMHLHRRDKARVRDMNTGQIIDERVGTL